MPRSGRKPDANHKDVPEPRNTPQKDTSRRDGNTWQKAKYVSLNLTEAQKSAFEEWANRWEFADLLHKAAERRLRVGVKWDDYSKAYLASMSPLDDDDQNGGLILTARAQDAYMALWRVFYIDGAILEHDWVSERGRTDDDW